MSDRLITNKKMDFPFDPPFKKLKTTPSEKDVLQFLESMDWWITENPGILNFISREGVDFSSAEILIHVLRVPIRRRGDKFKDIVIGRPIRVKELLGLVYGFYQKKVEPKDMLKPGESNRGYGEGVTDPRYIDLVGMAKQGRGSGDTKEEAEKRGHDIFTDSENRHPYSCSGLVRFEGLDKMKEIRDSFELLLGS